MNKLGQWLWWLDRHDPRFGSSAWAGVGYAIVWLLGLLVLILIGEFTLKLLAGAM